MPSTLRVRCFLLRIAILYFAALGVLAGICHPSIAADNARADRPNIIFILADDLGYHDLGCYGQKNIQTPNIDQLAAEGTKFTNCYTGAPVCAPHRCVLMTGMHTGHSRVRNNSGIVGGVSGQRRVPLEDEDVTVAEVLKTAGYATGITGKWGLGEPETTGVPTRQGFDEWFGYLNQQHAHSYYPEYLWNKEEKVPLSKNLNGGRETYSHDLFTQFALGFVKTHRNEPFFLYLAYTIPHQKYEIPDMAPYADRPWDEEARVHAAMITRMDRDIGQLMALLKELNLDDDTVVFFSSDNGAARRWDGVFDSSGELRANKGSMYEGGIRTPMIVRWPGRVTAGAVSDAPWYAADFLPTAAEIGGAVVPKKLDGMSILPTLLGQQQNLADRMMYWEFYSPNYRQAVRWRNWKAVRLTPDGPLELYDLNTDLGETKDVAAQHPDIVDQIAKFMATAHVDSPNWPIKRPAANATKATKEN